MEWLALIFGLLFGFGGAGVIAIYVHRSTEQRFRKALRDARERVPTSGI